MLVQGHIEFCSCRAVHSALPHILGYADHCMPDVLVSAKRTTRRPQALADGFCPFQILFAKVSLTTAALPCDALSARSKPRPAIAGVDGVVVFSAGTDGTDGPTDAAGAIADGLTLARKPDAREYLERNDSYHYFEPLGDLVMTGPTNTNVMDVRLILVASKS